MPTPSIQTLTTDAQQVLNLDSISAVRSVVAVALANANTGTPLNPNLTTQQLWNEFYQVVTKPKSDIESIIANQLMKFLFAPPAPGGVGADKQVIFNDGGVLAGDADFQWDKTANLLTINGGVNITTGSANSFIKEGTGWIWTSTGTSGGTNRGGIYAINTGILNLFGGPTIASHLQIEPSGNVLVPTGYLQLQANSPSWPTKLVIGNADAGGYGADIVWNLFDYSNNAGFTPIKARHSFAGGAVGGLLQFKGKKLSTSPEVDVLTMYGFGDVALGSGNLIVSNGKGIDFSATPGTGTSELLNDYEEGTWTPTVAAASGTPVSTTVNSAVYTKIGRLVVVQIDITIVDKGTASSSLIFSLPFNQTTAINTGAFRESSITGNMGVLGRNGPTDAFAAFYNNGTPWVNGYRIAGTYTYHV